MIITSCALQGPWLLIELWATRVQRTVLRPTLFELRQNNKSAGAGTLEQGRAAGDLNLNHSLACQLCPQGYYFNLTRDLPFRHYYLPSPRQINN